jgi:hypothetical protein
MQLRDIVEVNQQGFVADAVKLTMMADDSKNLPLCKGFVFNYDSQEPKKSTLGVLDAVRRSFHSPNNPNVHLMVQDFGRGKSHFAVTIANFFKQRADSDEVQGILRSIEFITTDKTRSIYEDLKAYKQRSKPHLVLCISGEVNTDLNKTVLQALRSALEEYSIDGTLAQHLTQKPLNYLKQLVGEKRTQAEAYLTEISFRGDLDTLIELLEEDDHKLLPTVVAISERVEGYAYNFEYNLDIEAILEDVIRKLCTGENRQFEGLLILFDELNAYLRLWLTSSTAAGGWALQNITNVCSNHKGKAALLCLAQVKPSIDSQVPFLERKNYERFTSRIELAPSTYEPKSSLELVIDNLLKQTDTDLWQTFLDQREPKLRSEATIAYERYITASRGRQNFQEFYTHLGLGCYPLHPLTAYLLCNLEFTQGRTIVQFIKEEVAQFINENRVETAGELNLVRPVRLIDFFSSNFAQQSIYTDYQKAYDSIAASADPDDLVVLKAIALYYLSSGKITKPDRERHEELLSIMTGFSLSKTRQILDKLSGTYQSVYYNTGNNTYRFYSGFSIADLRRKLEEDIENRTPSLNKVLEHCRKNLSLYLESDRVDADSFVRQNKLNTEDWQFERQIFTIDQFERVLSSDRTIRGLTERGLIAYFIGEYDQDLDTLEKTAEDVLAKAPQAVKERVILAIPRRGTRTLARVFLLKAALNEKSTAEKQEFGAALTELTKQFDEQIDSELQDMFDSCIYTCHLIHRIPQAERKSLEKMTSRMLEELYRYVPPVESKDTLRVRSTSGSQIIGYAARQLLANDLKEPFLNKSYINLIKPVLVDKWRLLVPPRQSNGTYTVQVPQDTNIREAWDQISKMTDIGDRTQITIDIAKIWSALSDAPFGHNELTFTILFAAWAAYHRAEVEFSGGFGLPKTKREQVSVKPGAPLHEWAKTNILEKPKDFIQEWVIKGRSKIIRRKPFEIIVPDAVAYDEAQSLIAQIQTHQSSGLLDHSKAEILSRKCRQLQTGVNTIDQWFKPTTEARTLLEQQAPLDALVRLYAPLEVTPPIVLKDDFVTVRPSDEQREGWSQVRKKLGERLEQLVGDLAAQAQTFTTVEVGYNCKAEIQSSLKVLEEASEIPVRFAEQLRTAHQTTEQRIKQLQDANKVQERLNQIQQLFNTLVENSPQSQYSRVREQIKIIADEVSALQSEEAYHQFLSAIDQRQDELIRKISQWEDRFSPTISREQALQLSQEINREINRFDDPVSRQQLEELSSRIRDKILERESEAAEETALQAIIRQAQQKAQSIHALRSLIDTIQAYDDLAQLSLPPAKSQNFADYQQRLSILQAQGRQTLEQKLDQLFLDCDRDLKRAEEYDQFKRYVQRTQKLIVDHLDFAALQERLETADRNLEAKRNELHRHQADSKVMQQIQQYQPTAGNTILRCEQIITEIESLRSQLYYPESQADTIQQIINTFQDKSAEWLLRLEELSTEFQSVESFSQIQQLRNELAKLELIFKDSTAYSRYEDLHQQLQRSSEDWERMTKLEARSRQIASFIESASVMAEIQAEQTQFYDSDLIQPRLQAVQEQCQQQQQVYIGQLAQIRETLNSLSTLGEARKLQNQVIAQRSVYEGSEYEEAITTLCTDLEQLIQLLSIVETQKNDTLESCQTEIERLELWYSQQQPSEFIQQRFQSFRRELLQTQQQIQTRQQNAACQWLEGLRQDDDRLAQLSEDERLRAGEMLLKHLKQTRTQHDRFLDDEQKNQLRDIIQHCETIRNQDEQSKIIKIFKELPREQRLSLYQKLAAYLESTTEVF